MVGSSVVVLTAVWLKVQMFWDVLQGYRILVFQWNVRSEFETPGTADLVKVRHTLEVLGPEP
jgi:hypothetical protein